MTYIRAKEIPPGSGNWYDYEVESYREGAKVRQRVIRYIGRSGRVGYALSTLPKAADEPPADGALVGARARKMKTPSRLIASAMGMYYGGMSLDAIQQQFRQDHDVDMSESNYWNWVTRFTREAVRQARRFKPKVGDTWVADETYMKLAGCGRRLSWAA